MKNYLLAFALALALMGCDSSVQTTSGKAYLAQYAEAPVAERLPVGRESGRSIEQRVREVASVEPVLHFPARIGLARIDNGRLSNIPHEEVEAWEKVRQKLGETFGTFVPVNIMIAKMVAGSEMSLGGEDKTEALINTIRLGSARQHLDAVLIYEVQSKETRTENILQLADLSIIGGFLLPSVSYEAEGLANGLLIDVVQGYPYGTVQTVVEKESRASSSWGWGSSGNESRSFSEKIRTKAALQLADESYGMFMKLRAELADKRGRK